MENKVTKDTVALVSEKGIFVIRNAAELKTINVISKK